MNVVPEKQRTIAGLDAGNSDSIKNQLISKASEGSEAAFQELVLAEHQNVRVYLAGYFSRSEQIEDLAQEVFLTAFRKLSSFRREAKFSTWLLAIARNKALQEIRTEIRRRRQRREFENDQFLNQRVQKLRTEDDLELHRIRLNALKGCLEQLPVHSRILVERFYFDQLPSDAIAEDDCKNSGAIRMKLLRIRKKLAACIEFKLAATND